LGVPTLDLITNIGEILKIIWLFYLSRRIEGLQPTSLINADFIQVTLQLTLDRLTK